MKRSSKLVAVLALGLLAGVAARADGPRFATDSPVATVETLHHGLVQLSVERPEATVEERYRALEPLIDATHDLPYIAQFALRRQWAGLAPQDRDRFVAAFRRLSVLTYASRFAKLKSDSFKTVSSSVLDSGRAQVVAAIVRPGATDVSLEYLLEHRDDGWRIINIIADGVSDLALKRAEYQRVLGDGTIDDLIAHLDDQAKRLE
jgi:phospholipid transport system substrate-binding protein